MADPVSRWRLWQGGIVVASGDDLGQGRHYALVYNEDGRVQLEERRGRRWVPVLRASKGALAETVRRFAAQGKAWPQAEEPQAGRGGE